MSSATMSNLLTLTDPRFTSGRATSRDFATALASTSLAEGANTYNMKKLDEEIARLKQQWQDQVSLDLIGAGWGTNELEGREPTIAEKTVKDITGRELTMSDALLKSYGITPGGRKPIGMAGYGTSGGSAGPVTEYPVYRGYGVFDSQTKKAVANPMPGYNRLGGDSNQRLVNNLRTHKLLKGYTKKFI